MAAQTQSVTQALTQPGDELERVFGAAAAARDARARLLDDLAEGTLSLDDVLERAAADPLTAKTKTLAVVEAPGAARKVDIRRTLDAAGIDHATPIGELAAHLTPAQRAAIEPLIAGAAPQPL